MAKKQSHARAKYSNVFGDAEHYTSPRLPGFRLTDDSRAPWPPKQLREAIQKELAETDDKGEIADLEAVMRSLSLAEYRAWEIDRILEADGVSDSAKESIRMFVFNAIFDGTEIGKYLARYELRSLRRTNAASGAKKRELTDEQARFVAEEVQRQMNAGNSQKNACIAARHALLKRYKIDLSVGSIRNYWLAQYPKRQ